MKRTLKPLRHRVGINVIMLCLVQIHIVSKKRGLSQKVFKFYTSICLLVDRSHRPGTPSVWLFSVILLFYNHRRCLCFKNGFRSPVPCVNVKDSKWMCVGNMDYPNLLFIPLQGVCIIT